MQHLGSNGKAMSAVSVGEARGAGVTLADTGRVDPDDKDYHEYEVTTEFTAEPPAAVNGWWMTVRHATPEDAEGARAAVLAKLRRGTSPNTVYCYDAGGLMSMLAEHLGPVDEVQSMLADKNTDVLSTARRWSMSVDVTLPGKLLVRYRGPVRASCLSTYSGRPHVGRALINLHDAINNVNHDGCAKAHLDKSTVVDCIFGSYRVYIKDGSIFYNGRRFDYQEDFVEYLSPYFPEDW